MPSETKIAATHRLQKDGRWDQACRFRERHREALRAQGLTRKESRERSWQLMIERFEPVDQRLAPVADDTVQVPADGGSR